MKKVFFVICFLCLTLLSRAQSYYTSGTHFIGTYPESITMQKAFEDLYLRDSNDVYIYLISDYNSCVVVEISGLQYSKALKLEPSKAVKVKLPHNKPNYTFETV